MKSLAAVAMKPLNFRTVSRPESDTIHSTDVCHSGPLWVGTIHDSD